MVICLSWFPIIHCFYEQLEVITDMRVLSKLEQFSYGQESQNNETRLVTLRGSMSSTGQWSFTQVNGFLLVPGVLVVMISRCEDCCLSEGQIKDGVENCPKCVVKAYSLAWFISSRGMLHFSSQVCVFT